MHFPETSHERPITVSAIYVAPPAAKAIPFQWTKRAGIVIKC